MPRDRLIFAKSCAMDDLINCSYIVVQPSNDSRDFGPWLLFSYDKTIQSSNRRDGQGPLETKHQSTMPSPAHSPLGHNLRSGYTLYYGYCCIDANNQGGGVDSFLIS